MRRRPKLPPPGMSTPVPDDLAAGPAVTVWADEARWESHRRGEVEAFDPMVSARRRWQQACARWVAAQPDRHAAFEALRRKRFPTW